MKFNGTRAALAVALLLTSPIVATTAHANKASPLSFRAAVAKSATPSVATRTPAASAPKSVQPQRAGQGGTVVVTRFGRPWVAQFACKLRNCPPVSP